MKRQVTIKDIAAKLGVSVSTVSRALQDHPDISLKTREAVKELAKILGYKPNLIALNLKNRRTNTIGLLLPEVEHYFFSTILNGIEEVAYDHNYNVMVFQSNESYLKEILNTQLILQNRVDGVLVSYSKETKDFEHFKQLIDNEIPVVFFDREVEGYHADMVVINDYEGARTAVGHLVNRGCKRIAFYNSPLHLPISQNRLQGYRDALSAGGIEYNKDLVYACDTMDDALKISSSVMKKPDRPDGVFAVNDLTAIGAMKAAKKIGLRIPEDVKIVGFENSRSSRICEPELTTINQFGFEIGKKATNILLKRIRNNTFDYKPEKHTLGTELIIREST